MSIFSKIDNISLLEKGLEAASLRQEVIANNIANVETPGFKRSVVTFEEELQQAIAGKKRLQPAITNSLHIRKDLHAIPQVKSIDNTFMRNDKNNVDIDREMALLTKNTIMFQALIDQTSRQLGKMRTAIIGN